MNEIETKLAEIQARADAATEGPLDVGFNLYGTGLYVRTQDLRDIVSVNERLAGIEREQALANAQFFAHSRTDIPALVKALRKAMEYLKLMGHVNSVTDIAAILNESSKL